MGSSLTKRFHFSASYADGPKVIGHNYTLDVTVIAAGGDTKESLLEKKVEEVLIRRIRSRDFGLGVDLLKGVKLTEKNLLEAFWDILQPALLPLDLQKLTLKPDRLTEWTLQR